MEQSEVIAKLDQISAKLEDISRSQSEIIESLAAFHETLKLILEACKGDGSGELVQVLRQLAEGVTTISSKMDALPTVLREELE